MNGTSGLEQDEITVLIEALEAWVNKDDFGNALGGLVGGILLKEGAERDEWLAKQEQEKVAADLKKRVRKERAILIQAKLIGLRDAAFAETAL